MIDVQEAVAKVQKEFNDWTRERVEARENPRIVKHGQTIYSASKEGEITVELHVANPGETLVSITGLQLIEASIGNPVATKLSWISRYPLLSASAPDAHHLHQGFPAPIFAGGLTKLEAMFPLAGDQHIESARRLRACQITVQYQVGAAPITKTESWLVEA